MAEGLGLSLEGLMTLANTQTFKVGRILQMLAELGDQVPEQRVNKTIFHQNDVP